MVLVEFARERFLDEVINCMNMHLYLLASII